MVENLRRSSIPFVSGFDSDALSVGLQQKFSSDFSVTPALAGIEETRQVVAFIAVCVGSL
jgi:hypothetical protein